ncbi:MAG: glycine zipper family protein [Pseudomonadota bacterium]|nr:glycine zipper family protein [Pseudomonadota bacterium]
MSKRILSAFMVVFFVLSACVSGDGLPPTRVITDLKGVDSKQYQNDLYECRRYAGQIDVGGDALTGLVAGALFGAAVGSALGNKDDAKRTAKVGAVAGLTEGTSGALGEQDLIIRNCLIGRGYKVLN